MKKIIIKKADDGVKIVYPNTKKYSEAGGEDILDGNGVVTGQKKPFSECKMLVDVAAEDWFITEDIIDKSDLESRKQLYHEAGAIKKDLSWEKRLMPDQLIKQKEVNALNEQIKVVVAAFEATEDMTEKQNKWAQMVLLQKEHDEVKDKSAGAHNDDLYWAERALAGLDRAETAKPGIKKKLEDEIVKLKG